MRTNDRDVQIINEIRIPIREIEGECYVSAWSEFLASKIPADLHNMVVCDFGAGTGILSIISALNGAEHVTAIERNPPSIDVLKYNFERNGLKKKVSIVRHSSEIYETECYDYIFCNPACYPNIIGKSNFYRAGEMGMDMINEVILFSSKTLKKNGHLLILIPSVSPSTIAFKEIKNLGMSLIESIDNKEVPFREELKDKLKNWIDDSKGKYPEMRYYIKNGRLYERVYLYDVHFAMHNHNITFFDGFEYTAKTLSDFVIMYPTAARVKDIPLHNELKSLLINTEKGLYILNISGDMRANFKEVKRVLGVRNASMTDGENYLKSLGLQKGTVCPVLKELWKLPQLISKEVLTLDYVSTNSGKLDECIFFCPKEILKHDNLVIGNFSINT